MASSSQEHTYKALDQYNFEHYQMKHLLDALWRTVRRVGVQPRQLAPDFDLESTMGQRVRLHDLRGQPVVLRFGSFT